MMKSILETGIGNYYGEVQLYKHKDKYYLGLESYNGDFGAEVSKEFAQAMKKEFKEEKEELYLNDIAEER